ncbi:hypothetical protein N7456_005132 [Penicillium angulare]|uniref:Uncharacterized protein n=1 Tax=Penicillium angulare TaxID=116970 RepID=A0A9W9FZH9_9EURO|nr:hypothetical protein N7456_005132 [Penicillium angulare]
MVQPLKRTFADISGEAAQDVDFSVGADGTLAILPLPEPTDSLRQTLIKVQDLAQVVADAHSLAVRTGYRGAAHTDRDPVSLAMKNMTEMEKEQYNAWISGATMPQIDWFKSTKPLPGGARSLGRFKKRACAMQQIWKNSDITTENASWLTTEMVPLLPLVKAVARIQAAERELKGGQSELTAMEIAEIQTTRRIIATSGDNVNRILRQANMLMRSIHTSIQVIRTRQHALQAKTSN